MCIRFLIRKCDISGSGLGFIAKACVTGIALDSAAREPVHPFVEVVPEGAAGTVHRGCSCFFSFFLHFLVLHPLRRGAIAAGKLQGNPRGGYSAGKTVILSRGANKRWPLFRSFFFDSAALFEHCRAK